MDRQEAGHPWLVLLCVLLALGAGYGMFKLTSSRNQPASSTSSDAMSPQLPAALPEVPADAPAPADIPAVSDTTPPAQADAAPPANPQPAPAPKKAATPAAPKPAPAPNPAKPAKPAPKPAPAKPPAAPTPGTVTLDGNTVFARYFYVTTYSVFTAGTQSNSLAGQNGARPKPGGVGTYADPITMAAPHPYYKAGDRFYLPHLKKYFMVEHACKSCDSKSALPAGALKSVSIYVGGAATDNKTALNQCALKVGSGAKESATMRTVVYRPKDGFEVDTRPLFSGGKCITDLPSPPPYSTPNYVYAK